MIIDDIPNVFIGAHTIIYYLNDIISVTLRLKTELINHVHRR